MTKGTKKHPSNRTKLALALAPFLLMFLINEGVRLSQTERFEYLGIRVLNSTEASKDVCSWHCHDNTTYCKAHHVKLAKEHFDWIDPVYFGIIQLLMSTGNYGAANLVFLVLLWPLFMYLLLIRAMKNHFLLKKER